MKIEQLTLFEEKSEKILSFSVFKLDDSFEVITDSKNIILFRSTRKLTLQQLLDLLLKSKKVERFRYGYSLFFTENKTNYELMARLKNYTTKKNQLPADYFKQYFDLCV